MFYLPEKDENASLQIDSEKSFTVKWFNPREGGEMQDGSKTQVKGPGNVKLENPPAGKQGDWVAIIQ